MNGAKLLYLQIKQLKLRFLDTMNYFPMALSKVPFTFGILDLVKDNFLHYNNKSENHDTSRQGFPEVKFYGAQGMRAARREK